jgi:sugar phosphate isomerase/epimerase
MNAFFDVTRLLSLHQLTALDAAPEELIAIAGQLGCGAVCLFTHVPEAARHVYPAVSGEDVEAIRRALADAALTVSNLEVFPLDRDGDFERFSEGLRIGAAIGATRATVHIHDATAAQAIERFAAFADYAHRFGIDTGLEFNAFSAVAGLAAAEAVVRGASCGRIVLDMLHLVRSGDTAEDVARIADLVDFAQLSDGAATITDDLRWREAVGERMLPGHGSFPLAELLQPLRRETIIDIEVPQKSALKAGVTAFERCRRAVEATRAVLA